ncbi:alanine racemase [Jiulongibacter sp. NS-SX5]|uniref:alanine racemase n=1 Tax=Jiulongibacter sp. NS-SX5 TaxID=3463854 RepID=UPI0040590E57
MTDWPKIENIHKIDSPSLVLFEDRFHLNIKKMIDAVEGNTDRLMPHVKTNKCQKVIEYMISKEIKRFKAATLVEAELAAKAGANSVLLAHQPVGPKIEKLSLLIEKYPNTQFSCIIDNQSTARLLNQIENKPEVYIDINSGMDRSGIKPGKGLDELIGFINTQTKLRLKGLHIYDGHLRNKDINLRTAEAERLLENVENYFNDLEIVVGGTPSFSVHKNNQRVICSPGTSVFHDWGYGDQLPEQNYEPAVLIMTRIISKPTEGIITVDMGHKSISSENPIDKRVQFLNLENYELLSQSEEHGVLKVENWEQHEVGDVFFGIPFHICPTVNLHRQIGVIRDNQLMEYWATEAAKR